MKHGACKEVRWNFTKDRKIYSESSVWNTAQRSKKSMDLMLNKTIHHLPIMNVVRWYGHVLRREDGHVLSKVLDFEVEGQSKKEKPKRTWKKQVD